MKLNFLFFIFVFFFVVTSCVTELPFDEQSTTIPVVNCVLTNDSIQKLSLTQSVKISAAYVFKEIKSAVITLSMGDSMVGSFVRLGTDNWQLKYTPQPGMQYQLKVVLADGRILTASTVMPKRTSIYQKKELDKYPSKNFVQYTSELPCWVVILRTDSMLLPKSRPTKKDAAKDNIGTDHPLADRFNQQGSLMGFIPTADTPQFLFYIRIQSDSTAVVNGLPFKLQTNYGYHTFICFRTSSEEYDKYMKTSMQKIMMRLDDSDPIIWFDESKVFSNINNGTGIFAAYSDQFFNYNDDNSYFL